MIANTEPQLFLQVRQHTLSSMLHQFLSKQISPKQSQAPVPVMLRQVEKQMLLMHDSQSPLSSQFPRELLPMVRSNSPNCNGLNITTDIQTVYVTYIKLNSRSLGCYPEK